MQRKISLWLSTVLVVLMIALAFIMNGETEVSAHDSDYIHHVYAPLFPHERILSPNPFLGVSASTVDEQ